jgi:hypothetical protein
MLVPAVYTNVGEVRSKLPALFKRVTWVAMVPWKTRPGEVSTDAGA